MPSEGYHKSRGTANAARPSKSTATSRGERDNKQQQQLNPFLQRMPTPEFLTPSAAVYNGSLSGTGAMLSPAAMTPNRAQQTPRSTTNRGGRGGLPLLDSQVVTHKKLAHRRLSIYDRVYGQILFPPVIRLFLDSTPVQRLRDLKQLGNSEYVYPSATHTRFEHSLGVSHLGMTFLKQILTNHAEEPELGINLPPLLSPEMQRNVWCVGVAGLCHDLGHGPLSHMFERHVNRIRAAEKQRPEWSHESASVQLLEMVWAFKRTELAQLGLGDEDLNFVTLLINGLRPGKPWPRNVGRGPEMRFLTDIIANKRSGLDVDKLDYLQRDSLSCFGTTSQLSLDRMFQAACVMADEFGETQICFQEKLARTLEEVFEARARQHRVIYQHRVTCVMDQMVMDAFFLADKKFLVTCASTGKSYRLSEVVDHPVAYVQTGEWIINAILRSTEPELAGARHILDRIQNRRIYTTIGTWDGSSAEAGRFDRTQFLRRVEDANLSQRLADWPSTHTLPVLEVLATKISKSSSDMKGGVDPMDTIRFFNPRHGAQAVPKLRAQAAGTPPPPSRSHDDHAAGSQAAAPGATQQTFILICRMPLSAADLNALSVPFDDHVFDSGAMTYSNRSATPGRKRDRSSSVAASQLSQNLSQRGSNTNNGSGSVHKRSREEHGDNGGGDGSSGVTAAPSVQLTFASPAPKADGDGSGSGSGRALVRRVLLAAPLGRGDTDDDENDDDVALSMEPLSQFDNSRSNGEEPEPLGRQWTPPRPEAEEAAVVHSGSTQEFSNLLPPAASAAKAGGDDDDVVLTVASSGNQDSTPSATSPRPRGRTVTIIDEEHEEENIL